MHVCVLNHFSHVRLFATPWTVAHHTPLCMGFSRQEYWTGLSCPPSGDLPDPGTEFRSLMSFASASGFITTTATWEIQIKYTPILKKKKEEGENRQRQEHPEKNAK